MENETDPAALGALNGKPQQAKPQAQKEQEMKFGPLGKAMQQFMMESYTVGATGGDIVRSGLEASYNSFSGLMEGVMKNNIPEARKARASFKESVDGTVAFNASRLAEYSKIWSGEGPVEDKLGQLNEIAGGQYQDRLMAGLAEQQNITAIGRYLDVLTQQQQKWEAATKTLEQQFAAIEAKLAPGSGQTQ